MSNTQTTVFTAHGNRRDLTHRFIVFVSTSDRASKCKQFSEDITNDATLLVLRDPRERGATSESGSNKNSYNSFREETVDSGSGWISHPRSISMTANATERTWACRRDAIAYHKCNLTVVSHHRESTQSLFEINSHHTIVTYNNLSPYRSLPAESLLSLPITLSLDTYLLL